MVDRLELGNEVACTYYTREIAMKRFKQVEKYCMRKNIQSTISISYNTYGKYYSVYVKVHRIHVQEIKDLLYALNEPV